MKSDIHPPYYSKAKITCACGNVIEVGATVEHLKTEICSKCHPFYTGKQKLIDTAGRVERFKTRAAKKASGIVRKKSEKKAVKKAKKAEAKKI